MVSLFYHPIYDRSSRILSLRFGSRHSRFSRFEHGLNTCRRSLCVKITPVVFFVFRGDGSLRPLRLFVVISFDDVAHHTTRRFAAVSASLHQHGNNNLTVTSRSIPYKPGVVFELLAFSQPAV